MNKKTTWRGLVCPITPEHGQLIVLPGTTGAHYHCPHSDHVKSAPMVNPTERTLFTLDEAESGRVVAA